MEEGREGESLGKSVKEKSLGARNAKRVEKYRTFFSPTGL